MTSTAPGPGRHPTAGGSSSHNLNELQSNLLEGGFYRGSYMWTTIGVINARSLDYSSMILILVNDSMLGTSGGGARFPPSRTG